MPIYLKYEGITTGSVTAKGFEKQIEFASAQFGCGRGIPAPTVGRAAEREPGSATVSELVLSKQFDNSSTDLFRESLKGEGKKAEVHFVHTTGAESRLYLKLTLTDTLISGYSISSGGDLPSESLSLNFTKIKWEFFGTTKEHGMGDTPKVEYDLATNVTS